MTRADRRERATGLLFMGSTLVFLLVGPVPILVNAIIGAVTGVFPSRAEGGILGHVPGYPAFDPQSWLLFLPGVAVVVLAVWSFPQPMGRGVAFGRGIIASVLVFEVLTALLCAVAYGQAPGIGHEGVFAVPLFVLALALVVLRSVLGAVGALPAAWLRAPRKARS